jgi:hypothetical protein
VQPAWRFASTEQLICIDMSKRPILHLPHRAPVSGIDRPAVHAEQAKPDTRPRRSPYGRNIGLPKQTQRRPGSEYERHYTPLPDFRCARDGHAVPVRSLMQGGIEEAEPGELN